MQVVVFDVSQAGITARVTPQTPPTASISFTTGTWTPTVITESGTPGTVTASGQFRRGAGALFYSASIGIGGRGSASGSLTFSGLPDMITSVPSGGIINNYSGVIYDNGYIEIQIRHILASTNFVILQSGRGRSLQTLSSTAIGNNFLIRIMGFYFIN